MHPIGTFEGRFFQAGGHLPCSIAF